jgi:hypothetical protein
VASAHPSIPVIDGDREWLSVRLTAADPQALIRELWESTSADRSRDLT